MFDAEQRHEREDSVQVLSCTCRQALAHAHEAHPSHRGQAVTNLDSEEIYFMVSDTQHLCLLHHSCESTKSTHRHTPHQEALGDIHRTLPARHHHHDPRLATTTTMSAPATTRKTIYVSSRKSQLAMVQTNEVIGMLQVRPAAATHTRTRPSSAQTCNDRGACVRARLGTHSARL